MSIDSQTEVPQHTPPFVDTEKLKITPPGLKDILGESGVTGRPGIAISLSEKPKQERPIVAPMTIGRWNPK